MFLESITAVSQAEEEARQAISLAQESADKAIKAAQTAGMDTVTSTVARAEVEISHLTRKMDQKAMEEAMELASTTANRQATLRARAERRLDAAAMLIFERIVNV